MSNVNSYKNLEILKIMLELSNFEDTSLDNFLINFYNLRRQLRLLNGLVRKKMVGLVSKTLTKFFLPTSYIGFRALTKFPKNFSTQNKLNMTPVISSSFE